MVRPLVNTSQFKKRQQKFLAAITKGKTIHKAATAAGVSRATIYNWREADADFAKEWDEAYENGTDVYEEIAFDRAVNGGKKIIRDGKGKIIQTVTQPSDKMLEMTLRGRRPQVYANHYLQHQVSGKVELENSLKTVEEARQRLLKLGVTPPTIEGDYEEVDASTDSNNITE